MYSEDMVKTLWIANSELPAALPVLFPRTVARSGQEALQRLQEDGFDVVWVCLPLPGWAPEDLLDEIQRMDGFLPVVFSNCQPNVAEAVRLVRKGAFEYAESEDHAASLIARAYGERRTWKGSEPEDDVEEPWRRLLVGRSSPMQQVARVIRLVGNRKTTVLITGETGTGKEVVARALHQASTRAQNPFVAVNCSALPENLLESELFGHVRGAYTGAFQHRVGRFEQAHRSTLFLDEIGDMPVELQSKLLRVLQEREIQRLGSSETVRIDVRVIAATNVDLMERIRQGRFREDLYYRLNVVPIAMPPLRERVSDIPLLIEYFLEKTCRQDEVPLKEVTADTMRRLANYSWPGNVREVENRIEMAVALSGDRRLLQIADFALPGPPRKAVVNELPPFISLPEDGLDFEQTVGRIERTILEQALEKTRGNKKLAAEMLRLKRTTLSAKLKSLEAAAG